MINMVMKLEGMIFQMKNKQPNYDAAFNIIKYGNYSLLKELVLWLDDNLSKNEKIDISQWYNDFFYIGVNDPEIKCERVNHPVKMRIAFTVDIKHDIILWNNNQNLQKGNCFVRDRKWIKALATSFPRIRIGKGCPAIHWYKETPSSRTQEKQGVYYRTNEYGDKIPTKKPKDKITYEVLGYYSEEALNECRFNLVEDALIKKKDALKLAKEALIEFPVVKVESSDREFIEIFQRELR